MEILHEFGFDAKLFVAQIVNFLILAYLFKRFLYKPLLATLKKRQELIEKGLKDAEKAGRALENAEEEKNRILEVASREADKILTEAKKQSEQTREELLQKTKEDVDKLIAQTKEQIVLEKEKFAKESRNAALEISKSILETAVRDLFDKADQEKLVKKGISNLKK